MTLPLTIIGGYLGAGKTTLLNHLLRNADGVRLAVLVNEFGTLPIDADLIEAEDGNMISIAGGCVCCSFGDDLSKALMDLAELKPAPDHVLLETSGVALPGAIAASLLFTQGYVHDGTIILADAETIRDQAADTYVGDTIHRQLQDADLIVLNKVDLLGDTEIAATLDWLGESAPNAEILPAKQGVLPPAVLLQSFLNRPCQAKEVHIHQPDNFETFALPADQPVDAEALAIRLASRELGLARAKGFVTDNTGGQKTIQVVGRRWTVEPAPDGVTNGVVVIGERSNISQVKLNAAWSSVLTQS